MTRRDHSDAAAASGTQPGYAGQPQGSAYPYGAGGQPSAQDPGWGYAQPGSYPAGVGAGTGAGAGVGVGAQGYATGAQQYQLGQHGYPYGAFYAGQPMHAGQMGAVGAAGAAGYVPPATSVPQQPKKPKRRRTGVIIGIVIAIICIALAAALAFFMLSDGKGKRSGSAGQLENKTEEEIQAEIDRQVEEGMFNISIASAIQFPDGASEGEMRIENVPGNRYLMQVDIVLDDTGETVYSTDIIEPDHHIQRDRLLVDLPAGNYNATATFTALDPETEEMVGQAAAKVVLMIKS